MGINEKRIRRALIRQLETCNLKFTDPLDLLNTILDQTKHPTKKSDKCIKCKKEQKNAFCMPCAHLVLCWSCLRDPTIVVAAMQR